MTASPAPRILVADDQADTSDPAGISCHWDGGTKTMTGSCEYTFGWNDATSTYIDVRRRSLRVIQLTPRAGRYSDA